MLLTSLTRLPIDTRKNIRVFAPCIFLVFVGLAKNLVILFWQTICSAPLTHLLIVVDIRSTAGKGMSTAIDRKKLCICGGRCERRVLPSREKAHTQHVWR